jgi:ABC-type Na+ transport system ATPase subunit NatA
VRIFATLLAPTSGRANVGGYDVVRQVAQVRTVIGLTGHYAAIDGKLTGAENVETIGRLLDLVRCESKRRATELHRPPQDTRQAYLGFSRPERPARVRGAG